MRDRSLELLSEHVPRKRFGQNFLVDRTFIRKIVEAVCPTATDTVVEIGPGLGALTGPLLEAVPHLHVVEIDRDIAAGLRQTYAADRLTVHEGDALAFDFCRIGRDLRLVGNLPYNISTPLLFHIAEHVSCMRDGHFMLQKEVVDRMVSEHGCPEYGRLSVMLQVHFAMDKLFEVPPGAFRPPPKVKSAVVRMRPLPVPLVPEGNAVLFGRLVAAAFSKRRKTLRNALDGFLDVPGIEAAGLDPGSRPEVVPVSGYVRAAQEMLRRRASAE